MLTARLAELGCSVVGVDGAPDMVRSARARGLDARVVDGHRLEFQQEFDAVFSNAALHWMKADPDAVIAGVADPCGLAAGSWASWAGTATSPPSSWQWWRC